MKLLVKSGLPAIEILAAEGITLEGYGSEVPAGLGRIAFINLMPEKIPAERDVLRLLSAGLSDSSDLPDIAVDLIHPATHVSRHTDPAHIRRFYSTLSPAQVSDYKALVINGAPLERVAYTDVDYYAELSAVCDAAVSSSVPVLYICWGAFFGLYRRCGVDKTLIPQKLSGVYRHRAVTRHPLTDGLCDADFFLPHSRHCVLAADVALSPEVEVLAASVAPRPGNAVIAARRVPEVYITAHPEYDTMTLDSEYRRDTARGLSPRIPENYYPDDNPQLQPVNLWAPAASRLIANWLRHYVFRKDA